MGRLNRVHAGQALLIKPDVSIFERLPDAGFRFDQE
jgi:hypothetical protein